MDVNTRYVHHVLESQELQYLAVSFLTWLISSLGIGILTLLCLDAVQIHGAWVTAAAFD